MRIHPAVIDRARRAAQECIRLNSHRAGDIALQLMLLSALGVSAMGHGTAAGPVYEVEPSDSRAIIKVGKAGVLSFVAGHTHEVQAPVRGRLTVDAEHLETSALELEIEAADLRVTGEGEPAEDVAKVQQTMAGAAVLDVARYPTIAFRSTALAVRATRGAAVDMSVTGELTLHGVTRSLSVPVHAEVSAGRIAAHGVFSVTQSDYGIKPITVGGVVSVRDALDVRFTIAAARRAEP
jgi:polyisoprenoid-binding protein YceI